MKSNRNYPLLLAGQFLGAFGDNFLLKALLGPLTYQLLAHQITESDVSGLNSRFSIIFFVPFILLAPLAGWLNDRMPKTSWLLGGNLIKIFGAAVGLVGVIIHAGDFHASLVWQMVGYGIVAIGACVYSPAKYGILPEIVPAERLVKANGTVEMLTLVAIVAGIGGGAIMYDQLRSLPAIYCVSIGLYTVALILNGMMIRTPHNPAARLGSSLSEFGSLLAELVRHPRLGRVLLGCGVFWFAAAMLRSNMQGWGLEVLQSAGVATSEIDNFTLNLLLIGLVGGIVGGSLLAGQLHRLGDLTWARRYGAAMVVSLALLGLIGGRFGLWAAVIVLVLAGTFAGLLLVPFNATLQHESDHRRLGKVIAVQNLTDNLSMALASVFLLVVTGVFGLRPSQAFIALAVLLGLVVVLLGIPGLRRPSPSSASPAARS